MNTHNLAQLTHRLLTLANGQKGLRTQLPVEVTIPAESTDPVIDIRVSDETVDRYGEIISASGWRLDNYRNNPVIQNAHQYGDVIFTLGKALRTEVVGSALVQRWQFAIEANPYARIAYGLYRAGFLNTASVGFIPIRWEDGTQQTAWTRKYLEQELLEVSAVGIPANPNALMLALKSGAIDTHDLDQLRTLLNCVAAEVTRLTKRERNQSLLIATATRSEHFAVTIRHGFNQTNQTKRKERHNMEPTIIDEFRQGLTQIRSGVEQTQHELSDLNTALKEVQRDNEETRKQLEKLRKSQLTAGGKPILRPGQVVSEGCARHLAAIFVLSAETQGKLHDHRQRENLLGAACDFLGVQQRAALTTTDIPMPIAYAQEVVELVWSFGQFRRYATVYPLGTLTTKLPKLSTTPAFGVIAQSGSTPEKSPQIGFVTFTAFKSGGIVRVPSEIDSDSIVQLGQFLARYIAREMARWEDSVGYLGDGTGTYGSVSGIGKKADALGNKIQLAATKNKPSDVTLADLRNLRGKVDAAALAMGAYYMHPTMESFLAGLNNATNLTPYVANGQNGPTLDGFPVRWIGVMPIYDQSAHLNQYQVLFGDHSYWYFGERTGLDIQASRDVYFATDEVGIRALERFDIQLMADNATSVLQLAAS